MIDAPALSRTFELRLLGRMPFAAAYELQRALLEERKAGRIPDQLLLVEHPHVVTMGRNGHSENLLAPPEALERLGISYYETNRGGDVTYHGPGQIVGYPILNLNEWQRDVHLYVRAIEQLLIDTVADFGVAAHRIPGLTGVWTEKEPCAKIAAIGVHISRWITTHGFALNVATDLNYFRYIVPCGLTRPVTSLRAEGSSATWDEVAGSVVRHFRRIFDFPGELHD